MFNINIDSSRPRPAARRTRQRGPINFDVLIDSRGTRRDVTRNLKRRREEEVVVPPKSGEEDLPSLNLNILLSPVIASLTIPRYQEEVEPVPDLGIEGRPGSDVGLDLTFSPGNVSVDLSILAGFTFTKDADTSLNLTLPDIGIAVDNPLNVETLVVELSLDSSFDTSINIEIPENVQGAASDDATIVT